jgi:two-component sensor histidine kinase
VASNTIAQSPAARQPAQSDDLLLRETNHRCSNDLQLVVSLLSLQSRRANSDETRQALADAMERVAVLAASATRPTESAIRDDKYRELCFGSSAEPPEV